MYFRNAGEFWGTLEDLMRYDPNQPRREISQEEIDRTLELIRSLPDKPPISDRNMILASGEGRAYAAAGIDLVIGNEKD